MKKKTTPAKPKQKRARLAKIADAKTMQDKLLLTFYGMTAAEYSATEMQIARKFFDVRRVDAAELEQRIKRELAKGEVTAGTETEFCLLKSGQKQLFQYAWTAVRKWKPEMFLRLAWAMQKIARHKFPDSHDARRRAALIANKGNVAAAVKSLDWPDIDPDVERDNLNRLKRKSFKTLFQRGT